MALQPGDELYNARKTEFYETLMHKSGNNGPHLSKLKEMISDKRSRYICDLQDLEKDNVAMVDNLVNHPAGYIPAFEDALQDVVYHFDPMYHKTVSRRAVRLGFEGAFGRNHISVRGLTADKVNKLVCVRGIVTKMCEVVPKLTTSVHYCPKTGEVFARQHRDATSLLLQKPAAGAIPKEDEDGNPVETDVGLSVYRDSQKFVIQELPEKTPTGQLPRYVEVIAEEDLVNQAKPGDRIEVVGVYRPMPKPNESVTTGVFPTRIIANNITKVNKSATERVWTGQDIAMIRNIAAREDAFDLLSRSFASNICGHETVKKGLLLLMIGGVEKNLANGTHVRGDLNVLMIGDPSCGKSQMLRFCMSLAPNCISTTGRGSSGVGLTAAVTTDSLTKERRLEAGAMVLGDRGVVCIDEFDKMGTDDRTAIHEVMEQQTVTIAKAGIHTSLNARCSVVAAANPVGGNWNDQENLGRNINLPDSLLSRFDLTFVIRDQTTPEADRRIATQVLKSVRYRSPQEQFTRGGMNQKVHSTVIAPEAPTEVTEAGDIFQKQMAYLYSGDDSEAPPEYLTLAFLKKYIKYVKENYDPVLSQEAIQKIAEEYAVMRERGVNSGDKENDLAVTTRTLESIIRLSTAYARMKCREEVTADDVMEVRRLVAQSRNDYAYLMDLEDEIAMEEKSRKRAGTLSAGDAKRQRVLVNLENDRLQQLQQILTSALMESEMIEEVQACEIVNQDLSEDEKFTDEEMRVGLTQLQVDGCIMITCCKIFLVR